MGGGTIFGEIFRYYQIKSFIRFRLSFVFEKGPDSTQPLDRFFEKGLENWNFYVVKNRLLLNLGSGLARD